VWVKVVVLRDQPNCVLLHRKLSGTARASRRQRPRRARVRGEHSFGHMTQIAPGIRTICSAPFIALEFLDVALASIDDLKGALHVVVLAPDPVRTTRRRSNAANLSPPFTIRETVWQRFSGRSDKIRLLHTRRCDNFMIRIGRRKGDVCNAHVYIWGAAYVCSCTSRPRSLGPCPDLHV
jgi:hypothetical protein